MVWVQRRVSLRVLLLVLMVGLSGCASGPGGQRVGASSSLVRFLYPGGEAPEAPVETIPHLRLPLRVGLAFVPESHPGSGALPEALKQRLLEQTRARFAERPYVRALVILPETYLRQGPGGFQTLEQLGRLYGLDVVALVSYDQVASSHSRKSALLYWTVIGAYTVHGQHNAVSTFVDTAVFDIASRRLLFRAPGIAQDSATASWVENARVLEQTQAAGFTRAMDQMIDNLDRELDAFRERLRDQPGEIRVSGALRGGGALGGAGLGLLLIAALIATRRAARPPVPAARRRWPRWPAGVRPRPVRCGP